MTLLHASCPQYSTYKMKVNKWLTLPSGGSLLPGVRYLQPPHEIENQNVTYVLCGQDSNVQ